MPASAVPPAPQPCRRASAFLCLPTAPRFEGSSPGAWPLPAIQCLRGLGISMQAGPSLVPARCRPGPVRASSPSAACLPLSVRSGILCISSAGSLSSQASAASVFVRVIIPSLGCYSCRAGGVPPAAPRSPSLLLSSGETSAPWRTTTSRASSGPPARRGRLRRRRLAQPDLLHRRRRTAPMELLLLGRLLVRDLPGLLALQLRPRQHPRHLALSSVLAPLRMACRELHERPCSCHPRSPAHGDNSYCHGFCAQSKLCHSASDAACWPAVLLQHHGADYACAPLVLVMGTARPTGRCRYLAR